MFNVGATQWVAPTYSLEQPNSVSYYMGILIGQEGVRDGRL